MSEGFPLDHSQHLQEVGQALLDGTLDRAGAVSRLIRKGWDQDEATAAVTEIVEQVDTFKKLRRDAARMLDDSPMGEIRASVRLQEAGFSEEAAKTWIDQANQQRHLSQGRFRQVVQGLRHQEMSRTRAVTELTEHGVMDDAKAATFVDVITDTAHYCSKERLIIWSALSAGTLAMGACIVAFLFRDLWGVLGVLTALFVVIPLIMVAKAWRVRNYWDRWMMNNDHTRSCPRNCSPMIMLTQGKGIQSTILTCTEWGFSHEEAAQIVKHRCKQNLRWHLFITAMGVGMIAVAVTAVIVVALLDPHDWLAMSLIGLSQIAAGSIFIWRGIRGIRRFSKA